MIHAFLKDSATYAIPAIISRGLTFLLVPLYTRVLSPSDYGTFDLILIFANLVNLTVALEISQGVARFYSDETNLDRKRIYASSAFWFTIVCYSLFTSFAFDYSEILSTWVMGSKDMTATFQVGIVYISLNGVFYLIQNQFRWELRSKKFAASSILVAFSTASVSLLLTYALHWRLQGLLWGMVFGTMVGIVYGLWHLRNSFCFRFDTAQLKEMLIFSVPLVPSGFAVFINNYIDRIMINHFLSIDELGLYGVGFRIASVIGLVMVGLQGALSPLVYTYYRDTTTSLHLARIFRIFLAFALIGSLGIKLFAYDIVVFMTRPEYYNGSKVVGFLVPAVLLAQMYIFAPGIGIAKKTYLILWINLGGAIINAALNWFLIPIFGIIGAAIATLFSYGCVFSAYIILSQQLYYVPHNWRRIGFAVLSITTLGWIVPTLQGHGIHRWALNVIAISLAGLVIVVSGLVQVREFGELKRLLLAKRA